MSKFLGFLAESAEKQELNEAFNTEAYELTFGKKNAGDIYFTFIDEDGKEFRIQFYTPAGLGKNVRQVFIGQKKGSIYPDVITKFKNPLKVIASMVEATKQYLLTPIGRGIDGFAINFSKRALERGLQLVPKIIRQSGLKQKLNVMDLSYSPDPSRGYVWVIRKGKDPAQVFDGPKMQGITWDDPDRVGDGNTADASNAGNSPEVAVDAPKKPATGWSILIAPEGNPNIEYRDAKGMMLGGIGVRFTTQYVNGSMQFTPVYGEFMGSSKAVNFRNIDGKDIKRITKDLKLPPIPLDQAQEFTKAAESWWAIKGSNSQGNTEQTGPNLANLQDKMPKSATLSIVMGNPNEAVVDWNIKLPTTSINTQELSFRTGIRVDANRAYITAYVLRKGQVINNPKPYEINIRGLNAFSILGRWLEENEKLLGRYRWVISQFNDTNYNPSGSMPSITWKNDGEMYLNSQSAKRLSSSQVLSMMKQTGLSDAEWQAFAKASAQSDAAKKNTYDKDKITAWYYRGESYIISNITRGLDGVDVYFEAYSGTHSRETLPITVAKEVGIMTPLDLKNVLNQRVPVIFDMIGEPDPISNPGSLAVFANQIRDRAPETRDVEWYVSLSQQGALLDVHWILTFRRNTHAGAVQAYQSQVNSANTYVQAVANLAKTKGFNVQEPRIMTVAAGVEWDRNAMNNGDDAYSEYEQSIGGGVNILVK